MRQKTFSYKREWVAKLANTLCSIRSLIIPFSKPLQVLVFEPWHPLLVLFVVCLLNPFCIALVLLLRGGQVLVEVALLFLRVGGCGWCSGAIWSLRLACRLVLGVGEGVHCC